MKCQAKLRVTPTSSKEIESNGGENLYAEVAPLPITCANQQLDFYNQVIQDKHGGGSLSTKAKVSQNAEQNADVSEESATCIETTATLPMKCEFISIDGDPEKNLPGQDNSPTVKVN